MAGKSFKKVVYSLRTIKYGGNKLKFEQWKERYPTELPENAKAISWIYKKCSMNRLKLTFWLQSDVFVDGIYHLIENNISVNDNTILEVAERSYMIMDGNRDLYPHFNFRSARSGLNQLRRTVNAKNPEFVSG